MDNDAWQSTLERERKEKDAFFSAHPQSPIPFEDRPRFMGLAYYPLNPDYRLELELHEHTDKDIFQTLDTVGNIRDFIRWGEFRFTIGNEQCALQVYKSEPHDKRLFLMFKDTTSGNETYEAGRYLDLDYESERTPEGKWVLDLNNAYNPWCAYSEHYACPYVPPENWLKVPILAGEKGYILKPI